MINTRQIAKEYRLEHWAQVMRERSESGLSIRAYCESIGLHENVYYYWQSKLREATTQELESNKQSIETTFPTPQGWVVCEARHTYSKKAVDSNILIEIGKSRVCVGKDADHAMLATVCRMLVGLC